MESETMSIKVGRNYIEIENSKEGNKWERLQEQRSCFQFYFVFFFYFKELLLKWTVGRYGKEYQSKQTGEIKE